MKIDWIEKLQHLLQVLAFCLAIAALQYAFQPEKPYDIPARYSLAIGALTWAVIDFGRHCFPSAQETGWPAGLSGLLLPLAGIVLGYLGGTLLGDWWCGFSSWEQGGRAQLRISIGITIVAGFVGTYHFYTKSRSAWLHAKVNEVRSQASEAQLKLLETQLEPHMLFNTLANLRMLIGTDPARAQEMLDRMIGYLRATLSASRSTQHPLAHEFDRLRDYLELMAVRMGPRLAYTLDLPDALRDVPVPPLLLQPLVENAIRHGLEPQVEGGHITVRASTRQGDGGQQLVLDVIDTGAGLPDTLPTPGPGQSFGLAQARERLATLHGTAGTLKLIAGSDGGTSATVTFPLKSSPSSTTP
ncbi:sensor histidine kinase [Acidovorax sp. Leaf78]|uniref:sensor histidine kinase n=1 Tax=Acidovorax sp. Leaf78 TaxID=1736237 RepID=UPI0006F93A74|nr:histidine kinase [Acidovorax sp. Leaf78]KQO19321.1 histidine kinase [Acidovorax sp. Leaf78]